MKLARLTLVFLAITALSVPRASALTADELAQFLGILSWSTAVDLPKDSYSMDVFEIVDGKLQQPWLRDAGVSGNGPEQAVTIVIGPHEGHFKIALKTASGTQSVITKVPVYAHNLSSGLQAKIGAGDFILFGQMRDNERGANDTERYARGFLLRVKIKTLSEAEEAKAQRCLAHAKSLATACKLFALDHGGVFPTKFDEIVPDYLADPEICICPLASEPHRMGYELLGGKGTDAGSNVLVRGRFTTPDGRRSVVYVNQWGAREWR